MFITSSQATPRYLMGNADTRVNGYRRALEICWLAVIFLIPLFFNPLSHQVFYLNKVLLLQFLVFVMLALAVADGMSHPSGRSGLKWPGVATSPLHLSVLTFGLLTGCRHHDLSHPGHKLLGKLGQG